MRGTGSTHPISLQPHEFGAVGWLESDQKKDKSKSGIRGFFPFDKLRVVRMTTFWGAEVCGLGDIFETRMAYG